MFITTIHIVSCVLYGLFVQADSESCLERASLLIEIHLKDLATHKALLTRNEMVAHRVSAVCVYKLYHRWRSLCDLQYTRVGPGGSRLCKLCVVQHRVM